MTHYANNSARDARTPSKLYKGTPEEVAAASVADCWTCQNTLKADALAARVREVASDIRNTRARAARRKAKA